MFRPIQVRTSPDKTVADIEIPLAGNGDNAASLAALDTLRTTVLPRTLGKVAGRELRGRGPDGRHARLQRADEVSGCRS